MLLAELISKVDKLEADVASFESALRAMRNMKITWENGIDNDERETVTILYRRLKELRAELSELLNTDVSLHRTGYFEVVGPCSACGKYHVLIKNCVGAMLCRACFDRSLKEAGDFTHDM